MAADRGFWKRVGWWCTVHRQFSTNEQTCRGWRVFFDRRACDYRVVCHRAGDNRKAA